VKGKIAKSDALTIQTKVIAIEALSAAHNSARAELFQSINFFVNMLLRCNPMLPEFRISRNKQAVVFYS
jgi:hypothetical protein